MLRPSLTFMAQVQAVSSNPSNDCSSVEHMRSVFELPIVSNHALRKENISMNDILKKKKKNYTPRHPESQLEGTVLLLIRKWLSNHMGYPSQAFESELIQHLSWILMKECVIHGHFLCLSKRKEGEGEKGNEKKKTFCEMKESFSSMLPVLRSKKIF